MLVEIDTHLYVSWASTHQMGDLSNLYHEETLSVSIIDRGLDSGR